MNNTKKTKLIVYSTIVFAALALALFLLGTLVVSENSIDDQLLQQPEDIRVTPVTASNGVLTQDSVNTGSTTIDYVNDCITALAATNLERYRFWKTVYQSLYPTIYVYDVGSLCSLRSGDQLVSFAYFNSSTTSNRISSRHQSVALFDWRNHLLKETKDFKCSTVGDFTAPTIKSVNDNYATLTCYTVDAGLSVKESFELDLSDFKWTVKTKTSSMPND